MDAWNFVLREAFVAVNGGCAGGLDKLLEGHHCLVPAVDDQVSQGHAVQEARLGHAVTIDPDQLASAVHGDDHVLRQPSVGITVTGQGDCFPLDVKVDCGVLESADEN